MYKVMLYNRRSYPNNGQVLLDTSSGNNPGIVSAVVDSKLNEAGSFTFTIVNGHPLYNNDSLTPMKGYISVEDDADEIFWGRIITVQKNPLSGNKQITCEGALAFMLDAELPIDAEALSMSAAEYFEYCVDKYNDQIGTDAARNIFIGEIDIDTADEVHDYKNSEYTQIQSVMKSKLIDCNNGFIRIWRDSDTMEHFIDWTADSGMENPQAVEIAENVVNQTSKESGDDIYTMIRAVGAKSGTDRPELPPVTLSSEMVNDYGPIIRTVTFGEATTVAELQTEINTYISKIRERLTLSGEISFVDLHFLDEEETKVMCGDIFTNIVGYPNKRLIAGSLSRDLLNPANDKLSLNSEKDVQGKLNAIGANSGISTGSSSSSGKGRSLSSGGSNWYKHIHETDETLSLTAKQLEVTAGKVTAIIDDVDLTVTNLSSLSGRVTSQEGKWTSFEGTNLYQNQDHITSVAGAFSVDSQTGYIRLDDGAQFDITPSGVASNVGKLVYSHDNRQKEVGELLMAYEGSYAYQHNDEVGNIVGRYQLRTSLDPTNPYIVVPAPATETEIALLNDSGGPAGRSYYEYNSSKNEYFKSSDTTYNSSKTYYKLNYVVNSVSFDAGGGFKIKTDGVEYGVYDEGNLTGGIIVKKVNGNETDTKILGSHIKVGTEGTKDVSLADVITITTRENSTSVKSEKTFWVSGGDIVATATNGKGGKVVGNLGVFGLLTLDGVNGRLDISPSMSSGSSTHSYIRYGDLPNLVKKIALVNNSNGSYDLLYVPASTTNYASTPTYASHDGWTSAGTFSRATSLTPAWSGGATAGAEAFLTISGTPAQIPALNYEIEFGGHAKTLNLYINHGTPTAYYNDNNVLVEKYLSVPTNIDEYGAPTITGGQPTFTTRYTANGVIDATIAWNQGEASGINTGWDNAEGMVGLPNSGDGSTITFSYPLKVTSGDTVTRRQDTKTYTLRSTRNDAYISVLNPDGESWTNFAHIAHNQYDAGNANRASQITTATVITGDSVNLLDADTVYKFQSEYKDANGNWQTGGTKVFKTKPGTPYEVPVASGDYVAGWNAARDKIRRDNNIIYRPAKMSAGDPLAGNEEEAYIANYKSSSYEASTYYGSSHNNTRQVHGATAQYSVTPNGSPYSLNFGTKNNPASNRLGSSQYYVYLAQAYVDGSDTYTPSSYTPESYSASTFSWTDKPKN